MSLGAIINDQSLGLSLLFSAYFNCKSRLQDEEHRLERDCQTPMLAPLAEYHTGYTMLANRVKETQTIISGYQETFLTLDPESVKLVSP